VKESPPGSRLASLRMGGWCAYFTMLSAKQQEHHIMKEEELA